MKDELLELERKYFEANQKARADYKQGVLNVLAKCGLSGLVRRKEDGSLGWLEFDTDLKLCFYKQKKDGTRAVFSSGYFFVEDVAEKFEGAE